METEMKKFLIEQGVNEIGKVVMDASNMFYYTVDHQQRIKFKAMKKAFEFHYRNNDFYRSYCTTSGNVTPKDLNSYSDLSSIPLIPIEYFKEGKSKVMMSLPQIENQLELHSSGATGNHSVAYRDSVTNEFCIVGLLTMFMELIDMRNIQGAVGLYLTPSVSDAPALGMLRALAILNVFFITQEYIIKGTDFDFKSAVDFLNKWIDKTPPFIVGPPFLVNFFLEYLKANRIKLKLDENSRILTTGGWKRYLGQAMSRGEFNDKCREYLGVEDHQIRDMYGLIELNQLSMECSKCKKHVPPFAEVYTRDLDQPDRLAVKGREGLIAILDPTLLSYPGFILTQDVGLVKHGYECQCGRTGTIINIIGSAPRAEDISCAITLDQYLAGNIKQL